MADLPAFREHGFDEKFLPLELRDFDPPPPHVTQLIRALEGFLGHPLVGLTVLDLGCGRGQLVGALRASGVRAFGVEVDPRFVESGKRLQVTFDDVAPILSTISADGKSIFSDGFFDLVISDQVIEHVADLSGLAAEVARVLKPGGVTCHHFPAKYRLVEPHYEMPFVHWLPKNALRLSAIKFLLHLGFSKRFFSDYPITDRAEIIFRYSVDETFYRPLKVIAESFRSRGLEPQFRRGMHAYVESRLGRRLPSPLPELIAQFRMVMFCAVRTGKQR